MNNAGVAGRGGLVRSSGFEIASRTPISWLHFPANPDCTQNARQLHAGGTDIALGTHLFPGPRFGPYRYKIAPKEARRIRQRLEFHYTPKHGSWLNMAEIEFSVFSKQCLARRIAEEDTLKQEVAALESERNQAGAT